MHIIEVEVSFFRSAYVQKRDNHLAAYLFNNTKTKIDLSKEDFAEFFNYRYIQVRSNLNSDILKNLDKIN